MWQMMYVPESKWKLPDYTWPEEREICRQCKHYKERHSGAAYHQVVVMICKLNRQQNTGRCHGTCFSMRYGGECGRKAKLFEPK